MGWTEKIGRLRERELPTVEVRVVTDRGLEKQVTEAREALEAAREVAWSGYDTEEQVEACPAVVEARDTVARAEAELKASALVFRFKTLPADVMETLRFEAFAGTDDQEERFVNLTKRIMVAAYIPEGDGDEMTLETVDQLAKVLTDGEWKSLQSAVLSNSQNNNLTWEIVGKD